MPPGKGRQMPAQIGKQVKGRVLLNAHFETDIGRQLVARVPHPGKEEKDHGCLSSGPGDQPAQGSARAEPAPENDEVQRQEQESGIVLRVQCRHRCQHIPNPILRAPTTGIPPQGKVGSRQPQERYQSVHPDFLRVIHVERGYGEQERQDQPTGPTQRPPPGSVKERHRRRADQDGEQANHYHTGPKELDPEME